VSHTRTIPERMAAGQVGTCTHEGRATLRSHAKTAVPGPFAQRRISCYSLASIADPETCGAASQAECRRFDSGHPLSPPSRDLPRPCLPLPGGARHRDRVVTVALAH